MGKESYASRSTGNWAGSKKGKGSIHGQSGCMVRILPFCVRELQRLAESGLYNYQSNQGLLNTKSIFTESFDLLEMALGMLHLGRRRN